MKKIFISFLISLSFYSTSFAMENAFYILHSHSTAGMAFLQKSFASLTEHLKSIDILIPQAYQINEKGTLSGYINENVLKFANDHAMKIMVLVTNVGFNNEKAQRFLSNKAAQKKAIQNLVQTCIKYHFYGVQFDFEGINLKNKKALSHFYSLASEALHEKGFRVSIAVVPFVPDAPISSGFLKRKYQNWAGVYDLKVLGKIADFLSIMSYDQHGEGTTPGPIADSRYVEANIQYALQFVSPEKISLGIPTYSGHWYMTTHPSGRIGIEFSQLSYDKIKALLEKYHTTLQWDDQSQTHYAIYGHNWLNEYLFIEDAASFKAKGNLAQKYHLHGLSVFNLGNEDPLIWNADRGSI
jgi:spore germination protein